MKPAPVVEGSCTVGFESVFDSFRNNFTEGWERGGAAFAIYHKGKKVVDLWGGWADAKCRRVWRESTLTTIFSCTKSVTAICMAILVDQGLCDYSDKVVKYWPEFGKNGKEEITIEMVMAHKAGLPYLSNRLDLSDLTDPSRMATLIENETPKFPPGTKTAYQSLSYGWIIDQIFRRVDRSGRGIGQFFREELADRHHLDIHMGNCAEEEGRVARLSEMDKGLTIRECMYDPAIIKIGIYFYNPCGNFTNSLKSMRNYGKTFTMFNNPDLRLSAQPAVNALSTARALAHLHQLAMEGSFYSKDTKQKLSEPVFPNEMDHTIGEKQSKGHGFMYTRSPTGSWQIGHSGVGGQIVKMDPDNEIVVVYVTNAMKAGSGEHVFTCNRLVRKVYECVAKLEEKKTK